MSARLIRALQSGGMASKLERDLWGIWRGRDRRRRMIGTMTGADVDVLRARECLSQVGGDDPAILIWSGQVEVPCAPTPSARALKTAAPRQSDPMLLRLLADCHDPKLRGLYRQLATAYRKDTELAEHDDPDAGLYWKRLNLTRGGAHVVVTSPSSRMARSKYTISTSHHTRKMASGIQRASNPLQAKGPLWKSTAANPGAESNAAQILK